MERREKLLRSVYEKKKLSAALNMFSYLVSALSAAIYCALLLLFLLRGEHFEFLKIAISAGVPFFAVGIVRKTLNAKRPYEIYTFYEICPKHSPFSRKKSEKLDTGASFPSRHAYSAFVIATLLSFIFPVAGALLALLAALMCVCRVLLGIHFVKDVVCGAAVGVISGVLGEFLFVI